MKVHDFHLENGDERCSIITRDGTITMIQVGDITLTPDQLEELYSRYANFEEEED